ncbi:hypothetical protein [uncultured Planococcus sp.]|nr:hypothetical protein [uncultured Planococcus sp.]
MNNGSVWRILAIAKLGIKNGEFWTQEYEDIEVYDQNNHNNEPV